MAAVKRSITACVEAGYDLLHLDPTVDRRLPADTPVPIDAIVERTVKLMRHAEHARRAAGRGPVAYEVGTEEVSGGLQSADRFRSFLDRLDEALRIHDLPAPSFVACDVSDEYTQVARRHWEAAGVADRIDLRIAPAAETLEALLEEGQAGTFDFSFIDADKAAYDTYYEQSLRLLRPGGVIALDNMFRDGRVTDPTIEDESVRAIQELNEKLHQDERVELTMLPLADGVTLAMKR
jgi:hypothetical protein